MADDTEDIGGISVSIGASHSKLVSDLAAADRLLEAWAKRQVNISIGATFAGGSGGGGRAQAPAVRYGAAATTGVQAQQGQSSLQQAINAQLAKTGEHWDAVTGEIGKATGAIKGQRSAIVSVQEQAAQPTALNIDTAALQNDLNAVLGTLREIVATASSIGSLPAARIGVGGGGTAASGGSVTTHERAANTDLATRIAKASATTVRRGKAKDDEGESTEKPEPAYGANFPAIQLIDKIERQRRESREVKGAGPIEVNRSEQSLNRQRAREEAATERQRQREEAATERQRQRQDAAAARASTNNQRGADRATLQALSAEAQASGGGGRTSATLAPPLSQEGRAALLARGAFAPSGQRGSSLATNAASVPLADDNERGGPGRLRATTEADIERRSQAQVARATAQAVSAARTAHTQASGLGGIFGGGVTRERIEATAALGEAEQKLTIAQRRVSEFETKGITTGRAYAAAREQQTVAETEYGSALGRVEKLSSAGSGVRNLLAITAAGAAFSLGLKAVDFGLAVVGKGFDNVFDIATGFGAETTKVTGALAAQTAALHGNSTEALANAEAQAGISVAAGKNVDAGLGLTTQIKAGAQAATSQQDLIRAGIGAGGGAPQGLLGGYGGVLNSPLFAQQLGGGKGFAETIKDTFGDLTHPITGIKPGITLGPLSAFGLGGGPVLLPNPAANGPQRAALEASLNDAAKRGATALGQLSTEVVHFGTVTDDQAKQIATSNLPQELKDLAKDSGEAIFGPDGGLVLAAKDATKALEQVAVGQGIAPVDQIARANLAAEQQRQREAAASLDTIRSQQAYAQPSIIAGIGRQLNYGVNTQLPVQQTLAGLANPNVPVGTGISPASAQEQSRVAGSLKEAQGLQDSLNAKYAQGQQIIRDTYDPSILKNFGAAARTDFDQTLAAVVSTGQEIASVTAGISNEQAAYQTAQYNFQLIIAKRNLSDIGGLINTNLGYGESYYGQLERQNLLIGRQAQLLQFALSQRQINFQVAQAGFVVPGVTPEERQANIREAQIEASYAQKQLDLSKQQFTNQVKLVDIGNLREGRDLLRQFGLLQQGRQVTIDTAAAEAKLLRLNQLQQQDVAKAGQYLSAVDNVVSVAFGQIQQLEAAAGRAMTGIATDVLGQFGIFIGGLNSYVDSIGSGGGSSGLGGSSGRYQYASGGVIGLSGPTAIGDNAIAGEAGNETLLVLAHPRSASGGSGGGNTYIVQFNGPVGVRDTNDIDTITRKVMAAMGKQAANLGLRSPIS